MATTRFGPDPFDGKGSLISQTPTTETWVMEVAPGHWLKCVNEWVGPILEDNQRRLNDSAGERFGDGQVVASIPLQMYFDKIVPMKRAGDDKGIRKLLNDADYGKLRTFEGNI